MGFLHRRGRGRCWCRVGLLNGRIDRGTANDGHNAGSDVWLGCCGAVGDSRCAAGDGIGLSLVDGLIDGNR